MVYVLSFHGLSFPRDSFIVVISMYFGAKCSNINCSAKDIGLEALCKVGTIIRTELGVRFCVDLLYSHRLSPVCVVNQDRAFHNHSIILYYHRSVSVVLCVNLIDRHRSHRIYIYYVLYYIYILCTILYIYILYMSLLPPHWESIHGYRLQNTNTT